MAAAVSYEVFERKGVAAIILAALVGLLADGVLALFRMNDRLTRLETRTEYFHGRPTPAEEQAR